MFFQKILQHYPDLSQRFWQKNALPATLATENTKFSDTNNNINGEIKIFSFFLNYKKSIREWATFITEMAIQMIVAFKRVL